MTVFRGVFDAVVAFYAAEWPPLAALYGVAVLSGAAAALAWHWRRR